MTLTSLSDKLLLETSAIFADSMILSIETGTRTARWSVEGILSDLVIGAKAGTLSTILRLSEYLIVGSMRNGFMLTLDPSILTCRFTLPPDS